MSLWNLFFFVPSRRTISLIRKRRLWSQKVRGSSWNYQGKITKSCFPIFVVETRGRPGQWIKVDRLIWIIDRSPGIYYSISIIYATSPYDAYIYVCFHFYPPPYIMFSLESRQALRCMCFLLTKLIYLD